jgi:putative addiction module component (TIGR02574 family)
MIKERIPELKNLSKQQKLELLKELWDDVENDIDFELSDDHKKELDRRMKHYRENPDDTIPWEEVKKKLEKIIQR